MSLRNVILYENTASLFELKWYLFNFSILSPWFLYQKDFFYKIDLCQKFPEEIV